MDSLDPDVVEQLRSARFSYPEVGGTRGRLPDGYHHLRHEAALGTGPGRFRQAADALLGWQVQLRAGLTVAASTSVVRADTVALLGLGVGPLRVNAPVRVVYVVDEPRRRGFAYGTLPGHPECGEELFCVELRADDAVVFVVTAFSRPQTMLARLGGPIGRVAQRAITARYLRALRDWS